VSTAAVTVTTSTIATAAVATTIAATATATATATAASAASTTTAMPAAISSAVTATPSAVSTATTPSTATATFLGLNTGNAGKTIRNQHGGRRQNCADGHCEHELFNVHIVLRLCGLVGNVKVRCCRDRTRSRGSVNT
jgi:hypothetical protein